MRDTEVHATDLAKRRVLKKIGLGIGAVFTVPLMASFSKEGLVISSAQADPQDDNPHSHKKGGKGKKK